MPQTRIYAVDGVPTSGSRNSGSSASGQDSSALDAQMNALRQQINQLNGASGIGAASQLSQLTAQYNNLLSQRNRQASTQATQQANQQDDRARAQAEAAQQRILGTAQGGIDRLSSDPTDQMFRQYLLGQMGAQVLDPNAQPFEGGAPQYTAQGYTAQNAQSSSYAPERMTAQQVNFRDPFDAQTVQSMVNEQAAGAGAAESARNQLMRDAVLASGGNAFDPSLAGAQAESLSERNRAVANARNQINMVANRENSATQNAASAQNAQFGQQAGQFNAVAGNQAGQFNAANQQQASLYNAGAQNQASQFGASAQNQAGMFNVNNQMQAQNANFTAGQQARMYNQGVQSGAASQLGQYNNQRQGMITDAEGRLINVVGQQVFRGADRPLQTNMPMPSFQQWSAAPQSNVNYAPGYFGSAIPQTGTRGTYANPSGTGGVWAGSGGARPGQTTTSTFGPTQVGNPWGPGASVGTNSPAVNRNPYQTPGIMRMNDLPQLPGVKQPMNPNARDF